MPPELITFTLGALPISELRGAIPVGMALGLPMPSATLWAVLGNLFPVVPLLLFLEGISRFLRRRWAFWERFFSWWFGRAESQSRLITRWEAVGLALFVAVPLPGTGAWTGCAAAVLLGMPFRVACPAITAGVVLAGLLVCAAIRLGLALFYAAA